MAIPIYPPRTVVRVSLRDNTYVKTLTGQPEDPFVIWNDDVYAEEYHSPTGWQRYLRVDPDGTLVPFIDRQMRSVSRLATDGKRLWWLEADGAYPGDLDPPSVEVWTAPYTNDGKTAMATATKVTTLTGPRLNQPEPSVVINDIYFFFGGQTDSPVYLTRGSDFKTKVFPILAAGKYYMDPVWTDGVELWGRLLPDTGFVRVKIGAW